MNNYLQLSIYIISFCLVMYGLEGINYKSMVKVNKIAQAQLFYIIICSSFGYLFAQFLITLATILK